MLERIVARELKISPEQVLRRDFQGRLQGALAVDALFTGPGMGSALGVGNLPRKAPVTLELLKHEDVARFLTDQGKGSLLILGKGREGGARAFLFDGSERELEVPAGIAREISRVIEGAQGWAGALNDAGEHVVDLRSPSPGPHFNVNLLLGNRIGYDYPLQTTPKSVVDRVGRGAFRSHAAMQVLATRWDMRQEENGFPANRQFYLTENGKKLFYSADPGAGNITSAVCTHSQNRTVIRYETDCGLEIIRTIFILPQAQGEPLATEAQKISIVNHGAKARNLRLVYTGMFGTSADHAVFQDVLYSNVIMQARVLRNEQGGIAAITPDYYPEFAREDVRFHSMLVYGEGGAEWPDEFCANANEFLGNGTFENPEGLLRLSNNFHRKGPGFFALACHIGVAPGGERVVGNFTGLVSKRANPGFDSAALEREVGALLRRFSCREEIDRALGSVLEFAERFRGFLQVKTSDAAFDAYVNRNLPFQVLYQTFVSRSFCQTQKGHREIGFREIQDLFACMYYLSGMGMSGLVKQLLKEWGGKVFEFGFAFHNFYWAGKEPGGWSDDALWFVQAVHRYIGTTGDSAVLDEMCEIAGTSPARRRTVYETIQAILRYSAEISIGKHGMPLLDHADWNDCLSLDTNYVDGPTKERLYRQQIQNGGAEGEPFRSDYSESVMNAFLLKLALDEAAEFAAARGDAAYKAKLEALSKQLHDNLQKHAWKGDFFARVLLNRYQNGEYEYLGAQGDKLSADPAIGGTYFLNSFNWAVLSGSASEEQISVMLGSLEAYLKTPYGLKLCSPTDMEKLASGTATGHYFPGDRENGAVFKHATMMATAAMVKAAKEVQDKALAARCAEFAYWMIDLVLPYRTMADPFVTAGNPRFCTQYNNSDTGENIGPMLSGTASWLDLTLISAFGLEYTSRGIVLDPILRAEQEELRLAVNTGKASYDITVKKPAGFRRMADGGVSVELDGKALSGNVLPLFEDGRTHGVSILFK